MLDFLALLLAAAAGQVAGGGLGWFFVRKTRCSLRQVVVAEVLLMLLVSLILVYEGIAVTSLAAAGAAGGVLAIAALNVTIRHRHMTAARRLGLLVFVAMCFHEFPEGIAFGSSYAVNPGFGGIIAVLIALHNLPEGAVIAIPYSVGGRPATGIKAILATQALYVAGGLAAYFLLSGLSQELQAVAMAFAAGAMLYIVGEEFLWARKLCKK